MTGEMEVGNQRLLGTDMQKRTVLPVLLEGNSEQSLPPLVRGRVFADFRIEAHYFVALFDLVLTMSGVGFDQPGIPEIRESQRSAAAKLDDLVAVRTSSGTGQAEE